MTGELLESETLDLSGSPMDIYERYVFVHSDEHQTSIFRHCASQRWIPLIDRLPKSAPEIVKNLFGSLPFVFYAISDCNSELIYKRRCAEWFDESRRIEQDVYFLRAGENGPIKIGIAKNTILRISQLQTGCPWKIKTAGMIRGHGRTLESQLHRQFAHLNTHGEWFDSAPELLDFIAKECE